MVLALRSLYDNACNDTPAAPMAADDTTDLPKDDFEGIVESVVTGALPSYALESRLGDCRWTVEVRQEALQRVMGRSLSGLPVEGFNYGSILGQNCELAVGYVLTPMGVAEPQLLDGREHWVPMATTEDCLVDSTNRGCKAILLSSGAHSTLLGVPTFSIMGF